MLLLEEVIAVATRTNLEIGVIADVVHATQLQSLAAVVNATSSNSSAQSIFQCINASLNAPPPSPLRSVNTPNMSMYGGSSTEVFLRGERRCFNCERKLGRDNPNTQCHRMNSGHCPLKDNPQAVAAGKIRAAKFKALKEANPVPGGGKSKRGKHKTNKEKFDAKVAADVLKAQDVF